MLRRLALAAVPLACLAPAGCDRADPLEAIRAQQARGDVEGSIEPLRDLLAESPEDPELNYLYGRALVLTQQPSLAVWSLRNAMEDPDWRVPAGLQLAQMKLQVAEFDGTIEVAGRVLEHDPDNLPALLLRSRAYAQAKKHPEEALADTDRILELAPDELAAYQPRVLALRTLERKQEAREALAEAGRLMDASGTTPPAFFAWHCETTADLETEAGELEAARETWSRCLERSTGDLAAVSGAMRFHDAQGEPERSLEILETAVEQAPAVRPLRVTLSQRLVALGRAAEAEALLREETESTNPHVAAAAWLDIGKLRNRLGEYDAAAEAIERALELARESGSPSPQLEFEYADTLVVAGQLARALEVAEELPIQAHRHMIRARVAQERRQPARALDEFEKGGRLWPDNPFARYHAGLAAEELGDFDRALEEFRYSVRIDPAATEARVRGASLLLAEGRAVEANGMLHSGTQRGAPLGLDGHLLTMRIVGFGGSLPGASRSLAWIHKVAPGLVGKALAEAAEGAARRAGPIRAMRLLAEVPLADYAQPSYAAALEAFVRYSHQAGETDAAQAALARALAAHPDSGPYQAIRGLELELSGAPRDSVQAAYARASELSPSNPWALGGLGRLALDGDPEKAVALFDRAAAAAPADFRPRLAAARALAASGKNAEAAQRLDRLLLSHPYEPAVALERARLDLERGTVTSRTLERAQRAYRFRGGPEALELLARVYEAQGEAELAERASARARALREARNQASEGSSPPGMPSGEAPSS